MPGGPRDPGVREGCAWESMGGARTSEEPRPGSRVGISVVWSDSRADQASDKAERGASQWDWQTGASHCTSGKHLQLTATELC